MLIHAWFPFQGVQVSGAASARLREQVEYALLLLRSVVTVPALLTLTKYILRDHWALPVGEIGKLLQEATSNTSLSSTIKEQFGGLKRFIAGYPEIFLIATDHRFNPQVYLREALNEEQEAKVLNGESLPNPDGGPHAEAPGGPGGCGGGPTSRRTGRRKKSGRRRRGGSTYVPGPGGDSGKRGGTTRRRGKTTGDRKRGDSKRPEEGATKPPSKIKLQATASVFVPKA